MLCAAAAPALNTVNAKYVGMKTARRPKTSESGPQLADGSRQLYYICGTVGSVAYTIGPTANPKTKSDMPSVKTSLLQLNSAMMVPGLPE